ncbi:hypothetical protein TNIN_7251 [Trichonephila inaurata madagascariensis]|uniref:Uncharacterized protein n=1 Tax=Trichonephila inaurata madagascariensis TaxID=2747483 RepID=A0A8X6I4D1_9ARAC|nr:hypothetical protein TNIN_7251 [Trichonephila inaurata madagascariensis]
MEKQRRGRRTRASSFAGGQGDVATANARASFGLFFKRKKPRVLPIFMSRVPNFLPPLIGRSSSVPAAPQGGGPHLVLNGGSACPTRRSKVGRACRSSPDYRDRSSEKARTSLSPFPFWTVANLFNCRG